MTRDNQKITSDILQTNASIINCICLLLAYVSLNMPVPQAVKQDGVDFVPTNIQLIEYIRQGGHHICTGNARNVGHGMREVEFTERALGWPRGK